jgi:hypothetical protein
LILLGAFVLNSPILAGIVVLALAVVAYWYYRKMAYFEGYDD